MAVNESELLSRLREAVVALKEIRSQRDALLLEKSEPIAIIGIACRFPGGANTPNAFYEMLLEGVDTISPVPSDRWPIDPRIDANPQLQGTRWGAFVKQVDLFDPSFFGISPREAERMDPQQRFLLELTWEALERSGLVPGSLADTKTGVFVGLLNTDYLYMNLALPREQQDVYSATGNGHSFPAGRLAYTFGFQGPAFTVDTACSSSLVAAHLACQSLRAKESDVALVCGVNLMLNPLTAELIAKTGALAPDGRCKSFDSRANGLVRGEGCSVIVLKRLSDAQRDGDPIVALIRGSNVNQDGRSTGLTTPNVLAQQAMIEQALVNAQLSADDIGYIEAHGTGTPLGDPIEMEALRAVFSKVRANGKRCFVGTVKTNIGHLEAAAGIAGLVKAALTLQHEKIPKILHLRNLNPRISLEGTPLTIATDIVPWPREDKPRRAGVSSFGMSGTNAHIILEEAPLHASAEAMSSTSVHLLPLSAKTPEALSALAQSYRDWIAKSNSSLSHIAYTASMRRSHLEYRLGVVGATNEEISATLGAYIAGSSPPGLISGKAAKQELGVIFVFPGQGAKAVRMGLHLFREEPGFHDAFIACNDAIRKEAGFSIVDELDKSGTTSQLVDIDIVQPMLFAIQIALVALWRSWGVKPSGVVGHSMGEVAAAHVAGALSLDDAAKIICRRSRLLRNMRGKGAMALVELTTQNAENALRAYENQLSVAVINSPSSTVIAGDPVALDSLLRELERAGVFCQRLKVDVASHSPQMSALRGDVVSALSNISPKKLLVPMWSTVTGQSIQGEQLSAEYWADNLRKPVLFSRVVEQYIADGYRIFLEMSPHPVLIPFVDESLRTAQFEGIALASLRYARAERECMLSSLAALHVRGYPVDWKSFYPNAQRVVDLPTYPWQRQRYWIEPTLSTEKDTKTTDEITASPKESVDDWLFKLEWRLSPFKEVTRDPNESLGTWLVFMDSGRIGINIIATLRGKGATCIRVDDGPSFTEHSACHYSINIANPSDYANLLRILLKAGTVCRGVIHLLTLDAPLWAETTVDTLRDTQRRGVLSAAYLAQTLAREDMPDKPRLWLISYGAIATGPNDLTRSVAQTSLWGLGRTIMMEHPELRCTCVDLDILGKFDTVTTLVHQLEVGDFEEHIALRQNGRFVGRIEHAHLNDMPPVPFVAKADASYLVTGGLGGLGLSVAQWMVEMGARHIALMGRRTPSEAAQIAIEKMKKMGAVVLVIQGDVAQPDDVLRAMCAIGAELPELRGVFHAAGVIDDRTLIEISAEHFRNVFAPKVEGAWNLHTFTSNLQLDFFVLYSSGASLFGAPGQANYAASNAFLDGLAQARHARGLPAMSIQWGAFSEIGLAAQEANRGARLESRGFASLSPTDGTQALEGLLNRPRSQIGVLRLNVPQALEFFPQLATRSLWLELAAAAKSQQPSRALQTQTLPSAHPSDAIRIARRLAEASSSTRKDILEEHVRAQFAKVLRMAPAQVGLHEKFHHYGMDSLMAIEIRNLLQASLEIRFSVTEIWTHASVAELTTWLGEKLESGIVNATKIPVPERGTKTAAIQATPLGIPGQWVVIPRPLPHSKMRLFCFPFAGGGAPVYSPWAEQLPADIEVCAIQPPGRHARIAESLPQSVEEMVAAIVKALLPYLDRPFAMFGHCLGAIIMFEVVRQLRSLHAISPIHLFASAAPSPSQYLVPDFGIRSDEDFLNLLRAIGLAQKDVLDDPDIVRTMLPMVKSDFSIAAKYVYESGQRIDVPITTFAANADAFAPPCAVKNWSNETSAYFTGHIYDGGHYFIVPERDNILRIVRLDMEYRFAALQQQGDQIDPIRRFSNNNSQQKIRMRVICFPGLGGAVEDFQPLFSILPPNVELCVIELPGHGVRVNEAPLGRIDDMVNHLMPALQRRIDCPFVLMGQDLGALLLHELTLRLHRAGCRLPTTNIVISATAPKVHYFAPLHYWPRQTLLAALGLIGLSAPTTPDTEKALQADIAAMASYQPTESTVLPVPIIAIGADEDSMVAPSSMQMWQDYTCAKFDFQKIPGRRDNLWSNDAVIHIVERLIR